MSHPGQTQFPKKLYNSLFAEISDSPAVSNPKLLKTRKFEIQNFKF